MKKYDFDKEQVDRIMKCANESIREMNERKAGCVACVFTSVSEDTGKPTKESDALMTSILSIVRKNLEKLGYFVLFARSNDGDFVVYIAKELFYIDMINTLLDMRPRLSSSVYIGLMGKVLGLSDQEIKDEIGNSDDVEEDD